MPTMHTTVDVNFEVYCGNCGEGVCFDTKVKGETLTVTCSYCKQEMKDLKQTIKDLKSQIKVGKQKKKGPYI